MAKLRVGDRVRLVYNRFADFGSDSVVTKVQSELKLTAVVRSGTLSIISGKNVAVEFDNPVLASGYIHLWDCDGLIPSGNGRIIQECCLVLLDEEVTGVLTVKEGIL